MRVSVCLIVFGLLQATRGTRTAEEEEESLGGQEAKVHQQEVSISQQDELDLLHGFIDFHSKCKYTGATKCNPGSGIPSIRSNDAGNGFRGPEGKSTAYPCALAMASSFDRHLVHQLGKVMAKEFVEKGSNMLLGPGLNVMRIPANGRTFEYLSGEDPVLGAIMGTAMIKGIQSVDKIMATAKHFILNNQETFRMRVSALVDEVTLNEIYLFPFRAAVIDGKVLSIMCSYNKINGTYACENKETLVEKLRKEWGFEGFVVSDWGATHSLKKAADGGLDQEMPTGIQFGQKLKKQLIAGDVDLSQRVTEMSSNILRSMKKANLLGTTNPSCDLLDRDVTSESRRALARKAAVSGSILLKNSQQLLPLNPKQTKKLTVIGPSAINPEVMVGGGSGHVAPGKNAVTAFEGIKQISTRLTGRHDVVVYDDGFENVDAVLNGSHAAVVVIATDSTEGADREGLGFSDADKELVSAVTKSAAQFHVPIVLVCVAPGPVLIPMDDSFSSATLMYFLPGEQFGLALGEVLFGLSDPGGRLPISLPKAGSEIEFVPEQYPGVNFTANYSEGLFIGYRWFEANQVEPLYSFGHGLSFGSFSVERSSFKVVYDDEIKTWFVSCDVKNIGTHGGSHVIQIYLSRRGCNSNLKVKRPLKKLVGFEKSFLSPGHSQEFRVSIPFINVAEWVDGQWKQPSPGDCQAYEFLFGASVDEIYGAVPIKQFSSSSSSSSSSSFHLSELEF